MQGLHSLQVFIYKEGVKNGNSIKPMKNLLSQSKLLQKVVISLLIMGFLFAGMDYSKFTASIGDIHIDAWVIALGLIYLQLIALSYRWLKLINLYEKKISFAYAVKVNLASLIANYLFITSIGGIIVRVAMSVKSGVSLIRSVAATGLDRFFTLLALLVLSIMFLPVLGKVVSSDIYHETLFMILMLIGISVLFSLLLFEVPRKKIIFSHRKVAMCFQYLRTVLTDQKVFGKVIASSLIGQIAYFGAVYFIMRSMGIEFSWLEFIAVIPVITIVASLPIGYGGWGIREGAFVYGLGLIHVPFETAFATSIQIGIISMAGALFAGIPALLMNSDIRQLLKHKTTVSNKHAKS